MSHPSVSTLRLAFGVMLAALLMAACSTVDCPLNNTVYAQYVLRGPVTTLPDTLTITGSTRCSSTSRSTPTPSRSP